MSKATAGGLIGIACTILATTLALLDASLGLPDVAHSVLNILVAPFLFVGNIVTYFCIVGDNWVPADFYRYAVPISFLLNASAGFLCGRFVERLLSRP